jgi:hypothetical protein
MVRARFLHSATLLLLLGFASSVLGQQKLSTSLALVPNPPKKLSDWRTSRDAIQLIVTNDQTPIYVKVEAQLFLNGTMIAMTKRELMTDILIPTGATVLYGADLVSEQSFTAVGEIRQSTIRTGILPEGTYEICIRLLNGPEYFPVSDTRCGQFIITQYVLPQLILPENGKIFPSGMEKVAIFRWSSMLPSPSAPVVYKLRAVEVQKGQTPGQAFANNRPLFEKKIYNMQQALWPPEIVLPPTGITIAWSVQPEDLNGAPYVIPESYSPPFLLKFLESSEACATLLEKFKYSTQMLIAMEERYWLEYDLLERAEHLQEEAEDRGDAYEVEHWQTKRTVFSRSLESSKDRYEAAYTAYEVALKDYQECIDVKQD